MSNLNPLIYGTVPRFRNALEPSCRRNGHAEAKKEKTRKGTGPERGMQPGAFPGGGEMKSYDYDDEYGWIDSVLKFLVIALSVGVALFTALVLAKFIVDTWTGGCIG